MLSWMTCARWDGWPVGRAALGGMRCSKDEILGRMRCAWCDEIPGGLRYPVR